MGKQYKILGLKLTDGNFCPLAKTKLSLSKREVKRLTKRFRHGSDFVCGTLERWQRFYNHPSEFNDLPEVTQ